MPRISDPSDSQPVPQSQASNTKKIVLAEDDPFISRMYQTKLKSAGFTVLVTNNGRDAYDQIKSNQPDLVMLDINMPELSGFEVIRALQNSNAFPLSRIVVLTNSADPKDLKMAASLGVEYMIKADMTPKGVLDYINKKLGQ
jgi:two-component system, cell cycle response regulator